ncbi:HAD family hydrolase [Sphingobacterium sp. HJSM2_6]|uniref:HAD family hydrolase n=1 Tax=Sphingobacterium sp. HJSM2_6 TaxID=3366264 RepID=UPI003BE2AFD7
MNIKDVPVDKQMYLFEVDDVLFPKQDYLLQVYYLFAQFVEFNEAKTIAGELVEFMKNVYLEQGEEAVIPALAMNYEFTNNYRENYERLEVNAHLPLKLLLFKEIQLLFASILERDAKIGILTKGNPALQLNKLKHIDWKGFDKDIKVYFVDELEFRNLDPINYIASENSLLNGELFFVTSQLTC